MAVDLKSWKRLSNGSYTGRITLFRSTQEPTGLLFDPLAGWAAFAEGVDLELVEGNHFTIFRTPRCLDECLPACKARALKRRIRSEAGRLT